LGLAAFEDLLVETYKEDGEVKNREITEKGTQPLEKVYMTGTSRETPKNNIFPK
jgi:hypothetical protein